MDVSSADPDRLAQYASMAAAGRKPLDVENDELVAVMRSVQSGCVDGFVTSKAPYELMSLLFNMHEDEKFVAAVHDALVQADAAHGPGGLRSIGDDHIASRLTLLGLADPPPIRIMESTFHGVPPTSGFVDDPINAYTGNFFEIDTDLPQPGIAAPLSATRVYNSRAAETVGVFGPGWTSLLDMQVEVAEDLVRVALSDGSVIPFVDEGDGRLQPIARFQLRLARDDDGGFVLRDGWDTTWRFDTDGVFVGGSVGAARLRVERNDRSVRIVDATSGRWVRYTLDGGRVVAVTTSDGRRAAYTYDNDRLVAVDRPTGPVTYTHDGAGRAVSATDADGVSAFVNEYDERGRCVRQTSPHGRVSVYEYLPNGTTIAADEHDGPRNTFVHDRRGNLTALVDGDGHALRLAYDEFDRVVRVTDRLGNRWANEWDADGNLVARTGPDELTATFAYDDIGRLLSETDVGGATTEFAYEADSRTPVRITGPDGTMLTSEVDDRGLPVVVTDPDDVVTRFTWDADGQMLMVLDALGNETRFGHDGSGLLARVIAADGARTGFDVDDAGRVVATRAPDGVTRYRYSPAGRPITGTDPAGVAWTAGYGRDGDLATFADTLGSTAQFRRDRMGNVVTVVAPDGAEYHQEYDALSRLVVATDAAGNRSEKRYDAEGNAIAVVDPEGNTWTRTVDAWGRTLTMTGPDGARTERTYHPTGSLATTVDAEGRTTSVEVDVYGRTTAVVDPAGGRTGFTYTPAGRVASRRSPSGRTETIEYDAAGRPRAVVRADGSRVELRLDARGRMVGTSADGNTIDTDLDEAGHLVAVHDAESSQTCDWENGRLARAAIGVERPAQFTWDPRGLLADAADPAGVVTRYGYDVRGRIVSSVTGDHELNLTYDDAGNVVSAASGVRTEHVSYDRAGRVTATDDCRYTYTSGGLLESIAGRDGAVLSSLVFDRTGALMRAGDTRYERDRRGLLDAIVDTRGTTRIERDADGIVIAVTRTDGDVTRYERNALGEITAIVDSVAGRVEVPAPLRFERTPSGRVVGDDRGHTFRYDDAGRIVEALTPAGALRRFDYNPLGLLAAEDGPNGTHTYDYNAAGQLVATDSATFAYDTAGRRVAETHANGDRVTYGWDDAGRLRTVTRTTADGTARRTEIAVDAFGRPVAIDGTEIAWDDAVSGRVERIGNDRYLHARSHALRADIAGQWSDGLTDDPWGEDDDRGVRLGYRNELAIDDLVVLGARIYQPSTRSFLAPDPLPAVPGALASTYAYASNDPVNNIDPSGLRPVSDAEYQAHKQHDERGRFRNAWHAMQDDPWGTLIMVGVIAVGVVLVATGVGGAIGAGILIGAAISGGIGVLTNNFNPRAVAVGGAVGGITGGALNNPAGLMFAKSFEGAITIGGAAAATDSAGSQLVTTGTVNWDAVADAYLLGAATGGATHGVSVYMNRLTAVYRGDGRGTEDLFKNGMTARDPSMALDEHLAGGNGLIATSRSKFVADGFGIKHNGPSYVIDNIDGTKVHYGWKFSHLLGESEVTFTRIPPEQIRGAYLRDGSYVENPNYVPRSAR